MKIESHKNNINFQKHLVANATIKSDNKQEKVKIYQFDNSKDLQDLINAQKTKSWENNFYLNDSIIDFERFFGNFDYYTMENNNKDILCFSIVDNKRKKHTKLEYLETAPKLSCYNASSRPFKYIGETMMAFLAHLAQKEDKDFLVDFVAERPKTQNFYFKQCGFKKDSSRNGIIKNKDLGKLIKLNATHVGCEIDVVG